jgi:hypothetical protein
MPIAPTFYSATNSMTRFTIKNVFFSDVKTLSPTTYNAGVVAVNSKVIGSKPTIVSFNASVVKINNASNSMARC